MTLCQVHPPTKKQTNAYRNGIICQLMEQTPPLRRWSFENKQISMVPNTLRFQSLRLLIHEIQPRRPKHNHIR